MGHFQRTAVYSASLYIYAMQALQAGPVEQEDFFCHRIFCFSDKVKHPIGALQIEATKKKLKDRTTPQAPTSQLLPRMSFNGFSRDREGRKDKGGGESSRR